MLRIEGEMLEWEVVTKRPEKKRGASISLHSVQMLELVFRRTRWERKNYRDYDYAEAFLVDGAGKRHRIPDALRPGIYYKKILRAIQEVRPGIELRERFDDSQ